MTPNELIEEIMKSETERDNNQMSDEERSVQYTKVFIGLTGLSLVVLQTIFLGILAL